jgi:hypothetical protein
MVCVRNSVAAGRAAAGRYSDGGIWEIGPIMIVIPEKQVIFIAVRVMAAGTGHFMVKSSTGSLVAQLCVFVE